MTLPAHFDGQHIVLDEPYTLEPNTALVVTGLPKEDKERAYWIQLGQQGLAAAYGDDEPEYTAADIKEWNPQFSGTNTR